MERFQPGDTVRFTCEQDVIVGRIEEIREGYEGNHLLVVRQGLPIVGSRFIVLSSHAERLAT